MVDAEEEAAQFEEGYINDADPSGVGRVCSRKRCHTTVVRGNQVWALHS